LEIPKPISNLPTPTDVLTEKRRTSALSLNTAIKKTEPNSDFKPSIQVDLPVNPFSHADFYVYWKKYIEILIKQGEKMLSSILNSTEPIVNDHIITLNFHNTMMMEEVRKNQTPILNYLRDKLQNFDLKFDLQTKETEEKSFIYTPQEKFENLLKTNPMIGEFRKLFDLDI